MGDFQISNTITHRYTPGPWAISGHPGHLSVHNAENGNSVCSVAFTDHEGRANAALIAAAPDLLKWLSWALSIMKREDPSIETAYQYEQARAALDKALRS